MEDIQAKLDKKLGPEYISKRVGFGTSRVAYIEGWKAINLANQIFGYNGWSTEVKSITIDFMDEKQGKFCIGCTAVIRVTLTDGTFREDIGYGTVENERRKSSAFERAKKSAVTDALKRSLRAFGNALGNCLYDKTFLAKIDKVKFDPPDFDEGNLYRATEEVSEPVRSHSADRDGTGPPSKRRNTLNSRPSSSNTGSTAHANEISHQDLPHSNLQHSNQHSRLAKNLPANLHLHNDQPLRQYQSDPQLADLQRPPQPDLDADELLDDSFMFSDELQDDEAAVPSNNNPSVAEQDEAAPLSHAPHAPLTGSTIDENVPVTFVTAKAAPNLQNKAPVPAGSFFDAKFQAQSIKHTVDQTTSSHIKTSVLKEKGLPNHRSDIYNRFAPKGKLLDDTNNSSNSLAKIRQPQIPPVSNAPQAVALKEQRPQVNPPVRQLPPIASTPLPAQELPPSIKPVGKPRSALPNARPPASP
ncbi:LADA_0G07998g1_1 [Lachancea dasiensis]|uniref:DNA repair and recombination protein RAD52 n=1 Tax=Lachancea dasiensis TaxID=1072105 RepID=A0A1G4JTU7_9SACH|nr:LADA_0G07998g1_1 [Lachancea dasiensis]